MKASVLRCELNVEEPPSMGVIAHSGSMKYLWRVWSDDRLVTDRAMPFTPGERWVELETDIQHPVSGDGHRWVWVRRISSYVVWFNPPPGYPEGGYSPGLQKGEVLVFDFEQYTQVVAECIGQNLASDREEIDLSGKTLPELRPAEFRALLKQSLPDADAPIYTTPKMRSDPRGQKPVRAVKRHFIDQPPEHIQVSDAPDEIVKLRIGLDLEGFPECEWYIGRLKNGLAVCFVSRPSFPIWLSGDHVDEAFGAIVDDLLPH